jgi:hypothetical protein
MKYIIDSEDMPDIIMKVFDEDGWNLMDDHAEEIANEIIKKAKPVEMIGLMKPMYDVEHIVIDCKYHGKNIEIYVKVI